MELNRGTDGGIRCCLFLFLFFYIFFFLEMRVLSYLDFSCILGPIVYVLGVPPMGKWNARLCLPTEN